MKLIFLILFLFSTAKAQLLNPPQDSTINFTDITTNNFSITKHGFVPKGTNVGNCLKDNGSWGSCGAAGSGFDTIGTLDSLTKSVKGASSTGSTIVMQTADTTNAGLVSVGSQTLSGDKTLSIVGSTVSNTTISLPIFLDETTGNFSTTKHGLVPKGTNIGNFLRDDGTWASAGDAGAGFNSIGTLNSLTKSTNGASSTGTSLVMQTADLTNAGLMSVGTQTISGDKTLNLTASTVSNSTLFTNTISGTTTLGGAISGASAVISNAVVSSTSTLGGTLTNAGTISGGIISGATHSGTQTFSGTLNQSNNWLPVSGTGMDWSLGVVSPTTVSTTTVQKILKKGVIQGTFTPSFKGATSDSSAVTYSQQSGFFTRIEDTVCVQFIMTLSAITGGGGAASVSGMPYVVRSSTNLGGLHVIDKTGWTTNGPDYLRAGSNTHSMLLLADGNTTNTAINMNNLSATTNIEAAGCYTTSE